MLGGEGVVSWADRKDEWRPESEVAGAAIGESLRDKLARRFEAATPPPTPAAPAKRPEPRDESRVDAAPVAEPVQAPAPMVDQQREQAGIDANTLALDDRFSVDRRLKSLLPGRGVSVRAGYKGPRAAPAKAAAPKESGPPPPRAPPAATAVAAESTAPATDEAAEALATPRAVIEPEPNRSPAAFAAKLNASGDAGPNACRSCGRAVFMMDAIKIDSATGESLRYHKGCLKCVCCNKSLSASNYAALDGKFYCKPHFKQLFTLKGNYNEGFGTVQRKHTHMGKNNAFCRPATAAAASVSG